MEEKDRREQKGRIFLPFISFTSFSIASLSPVYLPSLPTIYHPTLVHRHNGGKYDVNLLLKYALINNTLWTINGKSCIELNKAWIGFSIEDKDDAKIKYRLRIPVHCYRCH